MPVSYDMPGYHQAGLSSDYTRYMFHPNLLLVAMIKNMTKSIMGEERVYLFYEL